MSASMVVDVATLPALPLGPRALFVYYHVPAEHAASLLLAVQAMQDDLTRAFPRLTARLMVRSDEGAGGASKTWMEVYEHPEGVSDAFAHALGQAALTLAVHSPGSRHVESFDTLLSLVAS